LLLSDEYNGLFVYFLAWQVSKLQDLGFSQSDCENALMLCQGQLDKAAAWLTKHVKPVMAVRSRSRLHMSGFEVLYNIFY